jgi:hypothetical protein
MMPDIFADGTDLLTQALRNVGKAYGGRTKILFDALAKEILRLQRVEEKRKDLERMQLFKENAAAKKAGAELPYPDLDKDIPF